ncbi:OLC1v1037167C1 [Oldenlandia corymbosa var. corymbosa]|uniref:OLC1v1037167C1 n=1 Tax=Oldenlandia corymbosa var. corymbosa TaxID=529605 RepID=A0AAV1D0B2_OLDCO|nr:OLC1v1037167C1 [Oldenlandia corymbosa var. corymbosa]
MSELDSDFDDDIEEIELEKGSLPPPLLDLPNDKGVMVDVDVEIEDRGIGEGPSPEAKVAIVPKPSKQCMITRKHSLVWIHFTTHRDAKGVLWAECKYCDNSYMADSKKHGTSSLQAHLQVCKKYLSLNYDPA